MNTKRIVSLVFCALMSVGAVVPAIADETHNDGAAAAFGHAKLEKWRNDPGTPAKLALVTPGKAYMAARLKVEPGQFTVSQMARIAAAGSNASARTVAMMKLLGDRPMISTYESQGEEALAATVGVDAKEYSLSELARMKFEQDF